MEEQHRGLGLLVVDARLAARRGAEASAGAFQVWALWAARRPFGDLGCRSRLSRPQNDGDDADISLDDGLDTLYPGGEPGEPATRGSGGPIPETNKGFQLLAKLGWKQGKGLGRNEDGARGLLRGAAGARTRSRSRIRMGAMHAHARVPDTIHPAPCVQASSSP
jgi:hypothetical protein